MDGLVTRLCDILLRLFRSGFVLISLLLTLPALRVVSGVSLTAQRGPFPHAVSSIASLGFCAGWLTFQNKCGQLRHHPVLFILFCSQLHAFAIQLINEDLAYV